MSDDKTPVTKTDTLFQLVQLSHKIQLSLVESNGELTPEIEASLDTLHDKLPNKADSYKFVIDDLKAQADLWNERAAALSNIAKTFTTYISRMRYSLKMACISLGVEEIVGNDYRWKLTSNPPSLIVDDESLIPNKFKEVVVTTKIRSDLLKEALQNGEQIPGARLESGAHMRPHAITKRK